MNSWLINNEMNKRVRIRRLGPLLAARRVKMKSDCPSTRLLVDQLRQFPISEHDDGPDALEMALRLASAGAAGRSAERRIGEQTAGVMT